MRELADSLPHISWLADVGRREALYLSPAFERITGYAVAAVMAKPSVLAAMVHPADRRRVLIARRDAADGGYDETFRLVRPDDGSVRWVHDRAFPIRDAGGKVYRIAGIAEDISERREAEERMLHAAHYDTLTGLPNRLLFHDRLRQALVQARRRRWSVGILFVDLDGFKAVNDTRGRATGDKLLQLASSRLKECIRSGDTAGRFGGDEFALMLTDLATAQDAGLVAQKILDVFAAPFDLDGSETHITASIGIALYPADSESIATLFKNANAAMSGAKAAGRNNYHFYTAEMNRSTRHQMQLGTRLRHALERKEFVLYYQPKIDVLSGRTTGFEALIRWQSPDAGLVSPAEFIPQLEETGLIIPVGEWVLREACSQIAAWQRMGVRLVPVAINISGRQFQQPHLDQIIRDTLGSYDVDPRWLEIEITESSLMQRPDEAVAVLANLKALGTRISVDDFGTGYSSLSYLKRFPLSALKIDRSFVRDVTIDADDAVITRAILTMAHSLNLKVIAEGVQTEEQLAFLRTNRCDEAQGYLFSRPLPAESFTTLLSTNNNLHASPSIGDTIAPPAILVVDDDEDHLVLMKRMLERDGYRVLTASDAKSALEVLALQEVSVVISDQGMAEMPGVELFKRVRHIYPDCMRIMFSGHSDAATVTAAINEGEIHRFFVKRRDDDLLRDEIRKAFWRREDPAKPRGAGPPATQ